MAKKKKILIVLFLFFVIIGVVLLIVQNIKIKEIVTEDLVEVLEGTIQDTDPLSLGWEQVVDHAIWEARDSHAVVVHRDKIWVMGGLNGTNRLVSPGNVDYGSAPHFNDVWSSEDGVRWDIILNKAPWGERRSIQVVSFKNKMWLMGGWGPEVGYKNNIWSSMDGLEWKIETTSASWPAREGHNLLVFKDKIWLIGGVKYTGQKLFNDVWFSEDGVIWEEATKNAGWDPRWDFASTVFDNKLWVIGGMAFGDKVFNDVWSSEDGVKWTLINDNPSFGLRQGLLATDYKNKLWVIGKLNIPLYGGGVNDVWFSDDGVFWQKTKEDPIWTGREDSGIIIFQDKVWIIGGMDSNWEWKNDVWKSTISETK